RRRRPKPCKRFWIRLTCHTRRGSDLGSQGAGARGERETCQRAAPGSKGAAILVGATIDPAAIPSALPVPPGKSPALPRPHASYERDAEMARHPHVGVGEVLAARALIR